MIKYVPRTRNVKPNGLRGEEIPDGLQNMPSGRMAHRLLALQSEKDQILESHHRTTTKHRPRRTTLVPQSGPRFALATAQSKEHAMVFDDLLPYRNKVNNLTDDFGVTTAEKKGGQSFIVRANRVIITSNNPPVWVPAEVRSD